MDIEQAKLNPANFFSSPAAVCDSTALTPDQKVEILRRWEYDARELQVAAEENMADRSSDDSSGKLLDEVLAALHQLGANVNVDSSPPTKQGGN